MAESIVRTVTDPDPSQPSRRRFPGAFRRDAVRLVTHEQYTVRAAAGAVGISDKTLYNWVKQARVAPRPCGDDASVEQLRDENRRLRQQLRQAEMEREILKKAAAYFASQST